MTWSKGWWKRFPAGVALGRGALANVLARVLDGRVPRDDGDAIARDITPCLRTLVSEASGVKAERIEPHAALVHDLGIDPLDLIDLVTRIETSFGVAFPEGEIDAIRTFDDLVIVTRALLSVRSSAEAPPEQLVEARLRVAERRDGTAHVLERVVPLTPYDCETLAEDVARTAPALRQEIVVPADAPAEALGLIDHALLASRLCGHRTTVRRAVAAPSQLPASPARTAASGAAALRIARHAVDLLDCLSDERAMTVLHLASRGALCEPEIAAARIRTNRRVAAFRTVVRTYARLLGTPIRTRLDAALERLGDVGALRASADDLPGEHGEILDAYHEVSRALTRYVWTLELGLPSPTLVPQQTCLSALVAATEAGGIERAMVGGALARDVLTPADRADVAALIAQQHTQLDLAMRNAPDDIARLLGRCSDDPMFASVADYESRVLAPRTNGSPGIDLVAWFQAMGAKLDRLHHVEVRQLDRLMRETLAAPAGLVH